MPGKEGGLIAAKSQRIRRRRKREEEKSESIRHGMETGGKEKRIKKKRNKSLTWLFYNLPKGKN